MNVQQPSVRRFATRSSNSSSSSTIYGDIHCGCGERVILLTSSTSRSRGRKFLRCPNWQRATTCNFFRWVEGDVADHDVQHSNITSTGMVDNEAYASMAEALQEQKKKILKLEKKVERERRIGIVLFFFLMGSLLLMMFSAVMCVIRCC